MYLVLPFKVSCTIYVGKERILQKGHFFSLQGWYLWTGKSERITGRSNNSAQNLSSILQRNPIHKGIQYRHLNIGKRFHGSVIMHSFDHLDLQGALLDGPPGTGKTMLARALAHHTGFTTLCVSASHLVGKWHGDDARKIRLLFKLAGVFVFQCRCRWTYMHNWIDFSIATYSHPGSVEHCQGFLNLCSCYSRATNCTTCCHSPCRDIGYNLRSLPKYPRIGKTKHFCSTLVPYGLTNWQQPRN